MLFCESEIQKMNVYDNCVRDNRKMLFIYFKGVWIGENVFYHRPLLQLLRKIYDATKEIRCTGHCVN